MAPERIETQDPVVGTMIAANAKAIGGLVIKAEQPQDNTIAILGIVLGAAGAAFAAWINGRTNAKIAGMTSDITHLQSELSKSNDEITDLKGKNELLETQRFETLQSNNALMAGAITAAVAQELGPMQKKLEENNRVLAEYKKQLDGSADQAALDKAKEDKP
jgi:hypothetical protein